MKRKRFLAMLLIIGMIAVILPKKASYAAVGPFQFYTTYYEWSRDFKQVEARYIYNSGEWGDYLLQSIVFTETANTTMETDADGNEVYTASFKDSRFETQSRTIYNPGNVVKSWDFEKNPAQDGWTFDGVVWKEPVEEADVSVGRSGKGYIEASGAAFSNESQNIKVIKTADLKAVTLPQNAVMTFWAEGGMAGSGSGVSFRVLVSENKDDLMEVFSDHVYHVNDGKHYSSYGVYSTGIKQNQFVVDLSAYSGKKVYIRLTVDAFPSGTAPIPRRNAKGETYYYYPDFGIRFDEIEIHGDALTGWQQASDDNWLYYGEDGNPVTGWQKIKNKWYFFDASGIMQTGWKKSGGKWYYLNPANGQMVTGWKQISKKWYYFKSSGVMAAKEYCKGYWLNKDGTWTYKYKASWKKDSKGWWFGDASGWYAKNQTLKIDDKDYSFNAAGYCTNP